MLIGLDQLCGVLVSDREIAPADQIEYEYEYRDAEYEYEHGNQF